jgi:hypothetical protein
LTLLSELVSDSEPIVRSETDKKAYQGLGKKLVSCWYCQHVGWDQFVLSVLEESHMPIWIVVIVLVTDVGCWGQALRVRVCIFRLKIIQRFGGGGAEAWALLLAATHIEANDHVEVGVSNNGRCITSAFALKRIRQLLRDG